MKCPMMYFEYGSGSRIRREYFMPQGASYFEKRKKISGNQQCPGTLTIHIKAVDEPSWGDHFASLDVHYTCSEHHTNPPAPKGAPDRHTLESWVNSILKDWEPVSGGE